MLDNQLKDKLSNANSLAEVKEILGGNPELNPTRVWQELENHRSVKAEKLDLNELDAVSGGADRDWQKEGCAATAEPASWCWSNDQCIVWDVTYDNFWVTCPDGHEHVYKNYVCQRCGFELAHYPDEGPR